MLKRKTIIIILVILVVLATGLSLFNKLRINKNPQNNSSASEVAEPLPISDIQKNISLESEIKKQFETFVNEKTTSGFHHIEILGPEKTILPLSNIMPALNFKLSSKITGAINPLGYQFFSCDSSSAIKKYGLKLDMDIMDENIIKQWENKMLSDLHPILFPGMTFSPSSLSQDLLFKDGTSRYAEFSLPDGNKGSLNYSIAGNTLFISTSLSCLQNGVNEIFEP